MKKTLVILGKILLGLLLTFLVVTRGSHFYQGWAENDKNIIKKLTQRHSDVSLARYEKEGRTIRYATVGDKNNPPLLLVHGAPGGISTWYTFLKETTILNNWRVIIPDRPGYGGSGLGSPVISLKEQATLLSPLLEKVGENEQIMLVGHSLGPAVAAQLLIDYPEKISGLISIAGAFDPDTEKVWLVSYPMEFSLLRWLIIPSLRSTNGEKIAHPDQLRVLGDVLGTIKKPVTILHGHKDRIVPVESGYYFIEKAVNAPVDNRINKEGDHFIPFTKPEEIEQAINDLQETLKSVL